MGKREITEGEKIQFYIEEAAPMLSLSVSTLKRLIISGAIKATCVNPDARRKTYRLTRRQMVEYSERQTA